MSVTISLQEIWCTLVRSALPFLIVHPKEIERIATEFGCKVSNPVSQMVKLTR
jgi:hypothetical protein